MDNITLFLNAVNAARQVLDLRGRVRACRQAGYKASARELRRRLKHSEETVRILADRALKSPPD